MQSSTMHHIFLLLITSISLSHSAQQEPRKPFAQGTPKHTQIKKGPGGIRLTAHSDPFPSDVSPEIVACILRQHPNIEKLVKLLKAKEKNIDPEAKKAIPTEVLLVGEPGVGKTTIAAAIALTFKYKVAFFHASSLAGNRYQNSGIEFIDEKLRQMIKDAEQNNEQYVVIIDELSNLTSRYENKHNKDSQAAISHLWGTFDAFRDSGRFLVIATANDLKDIPSTIRSRFERNHFKIEKPNKEYIKEILLIALNKSHNLSNDDIASTANDMAGLTNRQIVERIKEAKANAIIRDAEHFLVTKEDIKKADEELTKRNQKTKKEWLEETTKENEVYINTTKDALYVVSSIVGITKDIIEIFSEKK